MLATPLELAPLVALAGVADELAPLADLAGSVPEGLAGTDLAVNLHSPGPQSWAVLEALGARRAVGYRRDAAPRWVDDEPERERWCRLVREAMALPADPGDLRVDPHPSWSARPSGVVVHPGAASEARRWPADRYGQVVRHLVEGGLEVTVTGSAAEVDLAQRVASAVPDHLRTHVDVVAGDTDLHALCRHVASAGLVISGDTGVAHLASAFGRPSVVLFGPTDPRRWGPPAGSPHRVLWAGTTGDPHADRPDPGLLQISTVDVLEAVDAQLAGDSPWSWAERVR